MAIHLMELSGKIAGVVFYKMSGKLVARKAPRKAKRTKKMKQWNSNFGVAAAAGRIIRELLYDVIPNLGKSYMHSRLSGAICQWMGARKLADISSETGILSLQDFQFNEQSSLSQRWKPKAAIEAAGPKGLRFSLPDFVPASSIIAPAGTETVLLEIRVASVNLKSPLPSAAGHASATIEIPYNDMHFPARSIELPVAMPPGCLIITACALRFRPQGPVGAQHPVSGTLRAGRAGSNGIINDPAYLPVGVVDGRYI